MKPPYTLYGWHLSYFTGKVRCYLLHKSIAFTDQPVNMFTLLSTIKRQTGAVVMPVLRTPKGAWVQDSSVIIDQLEAAHPQRPVIPTSPVPRFAAYLLEAWCDEWWVPIAMHTRWTYPENYALFERERTVAGLAPTNLSFADFVGQLVARGVISMEEAVAVSSYPEDIAGYQAQALASRG